LLKHQKAVIKPKDQIIVHEHFNGDVSLWVRGIAIVFEEIGQRKIRIKSAVDY